MAVTDSLCQPLSLPGSWGQFDQLEELVTGLAKTKHQTMSSNISIKRVCEYCKQAFTAKTTRTRFCSHKCNCNFLKEQQKQHKIEASKVQTRQALVQEETIKAMNVNKELLNIKELAIYTTLSERTLFRMVKGTDFPKLKVRNRLLFNKAEVLNYLTNKYGSL